VGTAAHPVLDLLETHGVSAQPVMLAHTDRNADAELHLDLIDRGAYLVYDTVGRIKYRPESTLLDLIERIAHAGKLDKICLGTDVGRRSTLISYGGGPGMHVLGRDFIHRLRQRLGDDATRTVLQRAPQTFLATRVASSQAS